MIKMVDLSIELCGLELTSPVIPAAGAPGTRNGAEIVAAAKAGAGAVMTEAIGPEGCVVAKPWLGYTRGGLLNLTTFAMIPEQQWFEKEIPRAKKAGIPIIVGIDQRFGIEALQATTRKATEAGADAIFCFTHDAAHAPEHVKLFREATNLPLIVKVGFHNAMDRIGKSFENCGADAVIAIDAPWGMRVNPETGKPMLGGPTGIGHFSGYPIFPMAMYTIFALRRTMKLPILGGGGIRTGANIAEMMMVGAQGGTVCSELYLNGGIPRIRGMVKELEQMIIHHEKSSVQELVDLTNTFISSRKPDELFLQPDPPTVIEANCTACGDCVRGCGWNAILIDGVAQIDAEKCVRCALCASVCPDHAIELGYWKPTPYSHQPVRRLTM